MKATLTSISVFIILTCHAQIKFDSLTTLATQVNKIALCDGGFIKDSASKSLEKILHYQVVDILKKISFKDDTLVCNWYIKGSVNCKGEVGDWMLYTDQSKALYSPNEVLLLQKILQAINAIKHLDADRNTKIPLLRVAANKGKLSVD
jgi:hypothetical protein